MIASTGDVLSVLISSKTESPGGENVFPTPLTYIVSLSLLTEIKTLTLTSSTTMALVSRKPNSSLYATLKAVSKSPSAGSGLAHQQLLLISD